jgi:hypothetical protein
MKDSSQKNFNLSYEKGKVMLDVNKIKVQRTPGATPMHYGLKVEDTESGISAIHPEVTTENHMEVVAKLLKEIVDKKTEKTNQ